MCRCVSAFGVTRSGGRGRLAAPAPFLPSLCPPLVVGRSLGVGAGAITLDASVTALVLALLIARFLLVTLWFAVLPLLLGREGGHTRL